MNGWIKLHRSMTSWEWYDDKNVMILFLHLLLTVNFEPNKWRGKPIKKGERITSISKLANETSLSVKQVRIALDKLESTGEVARKGAKQYTHIIIANWEEYQKFDNEGASGGAINRENEGQARGNQRATNKETKKDKKEKKKELIATPCVAVESITKVFEAFQMKLNPTINYGNKTQRKAAADLVQKFGFDKVINTIDFIEKNQADRFCPVITTPYQLQEKFAQLLAYARKNNQPKQSNVTSI